MLPLPDDDNFYTADPAEEVDLNDENGSDSEIRSSTPLGKQTTSSNIEHSNKGHSNTDDEHCDNTPYYRDTDSATPNGDIEYEPVPYSTVAYSSPTVEKQSTDFIDTSIPFAHPDMQRSEYETIDQIKFKINKEIELERTTSPIGMEFIFFAS